MQRPWKNDAHWLAPCGLLCLPSYSTLDLQSRGRTTHDLLGPSASIINQENVLRAYPQVNLLGTFFQFQSGFLFQNGCILYKAVIKLDRLLIKFNKTGKALMLSFIYNILNLHNNIKMVKKEEKASSLLNIHIPLFINEKICMSMCKIHCGSHFKI